MDSSNRFLVSLSSDPKHREAPILIRHVANCAGWISREEAVNLAAWLRVLADPTGEIFNPLVEELLRG